MKTHTVSITNIVELSGIYFMTLQLPLNGKKSVLMPACGEVMIFQYRA